MKHKGSLSSLIVQSNKLTKEELDLSKFMREHFYINSPNPLMVSISGSSEQNLHYSGDKQVLDASSMYSDEQLNLIIATADGLGESEEDLDDNKNNAFISAFCTEHFCKQVIEKKSLPTVQFLSDLASESKKANQISASGFPYDGRTAMSTLAFNAQSKQAHVLAIGDTLTIVFDGYTGNVKYQQKARVYNQGGSIWAPVDLQLLANKNQSVANFAQSTIQELHWQLEENDIVIQMSDGIWSEFPTLDQEYAIDGASYIETELAIKNLSEIINNFNSKAFNALDISRAILTESMTNYSNNLSIFRSIHQELAKQLDEADPQQMMQDFIKNLPPITSASFKKLFVAQKHDSISYHDEMPVQFFRSQYQRISFGDCSTLNVIKIPSNNEHLLHRLLDNMNSLYNHSDLIQKVADMPKDDFVDLINKLRSYQLISEEAVPFSNNIAVSAYSKEHLDCLLSFINHYREYQQIIKLNKDEAIAHNKVIQYIKSIKILEERKFLSKFLEQSNPLSIWTSLSHFFFSVKSEQETYHNALHQLSNESSLK